MDTVLDGAMDAETPAEEVVERLRVLCPSDRYDYKEFRQLATLLYEGEPETVILAIRLLSTGVKESHLGICRHIISALGVIENEGDGETVSFGKSLKYDLLMAWNVANMKNLTHTVDDGEEPMINAIWWNNLLVGREEIDRTHDEDYWRGLALLGICAGYSKDESDKAEAFEFVQWAAKQSDPERLVLMSKERDTIDVEVLQSIMSQQDQITAGLREGIL